MGKRIERSIKETAALRNQGRRPAEWADKAANSSKCLTALFLNFGAFLLLNLKWAGGHFGAFPP